VAILHVRRVRHLRLFVRNFHAAVYVAPVVTLPFPAGTTWHWLQSTGRIVRVGDGPLQVTDAA